MTTYPAPIQLGQASGKFHFLVLKTYSGMCWKWLQTTAMVNLLLKPPKKSNGLKGNHMNISKTVAPKLSSLEIHSP